ncbi:MAG: hypothetical protein OQL19_10970 [Gammaproteobacteria bacterium]|nr:hypothetical protein [Gammaproteobacteria bacterium]
MLSNKRAKLTKILIKALELKIKIKPLTKKIVLIYGIWFVFWVLLTLYGKYFTNHDEFGVSSHLLLTLTGLPMSIFSWFGPNGTLNGVLLAGTIGLTQWCAISEISGHLKTKKK